ncbi:prolyl oligopeptidase family serine peptidase [Neobacillus sp. PS3-34]|uniref:prolyl oligopeptidase family serine peptidase n=1 Tax=Neobacillus sp. PS3-34 TaxID=3070678 RepID=UPI0027E14A86|nr:prolyl oligopeptidase family serine peptidase [Neobacillus sp. PS3-34]WML49037.1 prolyl oligopeptidase family serine peptidase [Neobacillus sp. PS3-34]
MTMVIKKDNIVEDFHGTMVVDPYRWLEDPNSKETIQWGKELGEKCEAYFKDTSTREEDKTRLTELWNYPKLFVPKRVKDKLFYQKNDGLQNQAVMYKKDGEEDTVLLDPNKLSDDGTVAMTNYAFSGDGRYLAYATSTHGSDWQEIYVREIESRRDLEDHIQFVKFTSIAWTPDYSGFFYSRFPEPGTVSEEDEGNYHKVYFHQLGTLQDQDTLIFEHPDNKELMFTTFVTNDDQYICLHVSHGTAAQNRFYLKKLGSTGEFTRLLDEQDAEYSYIHNEGTLFYFKTDLEAPRGRIIAIDIENPSHDNWKEIVGEQENVIDAVKFINGQFVIAYLADAFHQVHLYNEDGSYEKQIDIPVIGSLTDLSGKHDQTEMFFGMTSFLSPTVVYRYDFLNGELEVFAESELKIDTSQFETKQVFYTSNDGTKVPMFLTMKKNLPLNGQNPVILYGYGGFNVSMTPGFNPAILRWLEKGGIYAVTNLRGGSEYGEDWHKAGMLDKKQNVFDDFISAGEYLINNNYTSKNKLSISGGSNGGLLVAACMVQRPDLFGAVICRVPVIDMLRYHKFTIGKYWISEYGNAENAEQFPFLYAYSPLHNIKEGQKYPPVLIATAESDDRVVPAHAKKFAATLLEKASEDSTIVLRLEAKAGHRLGKPTSKLIDEWADFYAFLDKELV